MPNGLKEIPMINEIADEISHVKITHTTNSELIFDYSQLKQMYPQLQSCRLFQPKTKLLSGLWEFLLIVKCPGLQRVLRRSKTVDLGILVSNLV